jgi:hypothetical protein
VFVDGAPLGSTPLRALSLEPGAHTVLLVNRELGLERTLSVDIDPGQPRALDVKLTP